MQLNFRSLFVETFGILAISVLLLFLFSGNMGNLVSGQAMDWSIEWLDVKTLFISILLEAIPFVLLGVFFAALIQTFVSDEQVRRWTPKNPIVAIPFATMLGFLFPVCECAIIPVVRRLMQKGMPVYVGVVFLLAGPIVNPIVLMSTYTAFARQPEMMWYRGGIAIAVAALVGLFVLLFIRQNPLKIGVEREVQHEDAHLQANAGKMSATFQHAVDEFFDVGKYLLFGALVSAIIQTFVAREQLLDIGQTPLTANLMMMGLAYVFSLCSEADAFIAASFGTTFSAGSLLAFMVFGPMVDFKNTLMLLSAFKFRFVLQLIVLVTVLVLAFTLMVPL